MSATGPSPLREDLKQLSDKELIQSYCTIAPPRDENEEAQAVSTELWRRYGESVVYKKLRMLSFSAGALCPVFYDRQAFLDSSFTQTYLNFTRRLCGFRLEGLFFEQRFNKWLELVARTAALDERRRIVGRPIASSSKFSEFAVITSKDKEICQSESEEEAQRARRAFESYDAELYDQRAEGTNPISFLGRAQPLPKSDSGVMAKERKLVVRELLKQHAAASEESAQSAYTIRLRHWLDWTLAGIGAHFFGDPCGEVERNNLEVRIRRVLLGDYKKLRILLTESFGISSLQHI